MPTQQRRVNYNVGSSSVRYVPSTSEDIETAEDEDYDDPPRSHSSVVPYRRRAVGSYAPPQITEQIPKRGVDFHRFMMICLLFIFIGILIAIIINAFVIPTYQRWRDDQTYGYPRIIRVTANVGQGDSSHPQSQFIGINTNGVIDVIEMSYGNIDQSHTHIYYIGTMTGNNADLIPITAITFADVAGKGRLDMEVVVNNSVFVLYNDGKQFQPHP